MDRWKEGRDKQMRDEGQKEGRIEEWKDARHNGRKEGKKEGKKEGRKERKEGKEVDEDSDFFCQTKRAHLTQYHAQYAYHAHYPDCLHFRCDFLFRKIKGRVSVNFAVADFSTTFLYGCFCCLVQIRVADYRIYLTDSNCRCKYQST